MALGAVVEETQGEWKVSPGDGLHVLVVEDHDAVREGLGAFARREGFTVDLAADGEQGLELLGRRRPDIILLDLVLPRMSGYQFMEHLVGRFGRSRPSVVVLSAAERLDLARARLGAEAYIAKPFDVERLRAALARLSLQVRHVNRRACLRAAAGV